MQVTFINEPRLQILGNGSEWLLAEDFHVRIESGDGDEPIAFTIPAGFSTDLASVPRLPVVHMLFAGRARRSAILHDWLYVSRYPRGWADDVFRAAMRNEDVGALARWFMWAGVRIGGGPIYAAHDAKPDPDPRPEHYNPQ